MINLKVLHYDDSIGTRLDFNTYFIAINKEFDRYSVFFKYIQKAEIEDFLSSLDKEAPDIIILDMYDENHEAVGVRALEHIKLHDLESQVFIYTKGSIDNREIDYYTLRQKYSFIGPKVKSLGAFELRRDLKMYVVNRYLFDDLVKFDKDDILLIAEVNSIGKANLSDILFKIQDHLGVHEPFLLKRMSSGFSGAAVFKLVSSNGRTRILKISREKANLLRELKSAEKLYKLFPLQFRIDIDSTLFDNDEVVAGLIEEARTGITLFNWLQQTNDQKAITDFFEKLFFDFGLSDHYKSNFLDKRKFTYIIDWLKDGNYALISKSSEELLVILSRFSYKYVESDVRIFVHNGIFGKIDKNRMLDDSYSKPLTLSHGDFHSGNILVQGKRPILIDTGGIRYDFWCMDCSRLLVNLFISGFDCNSAEHYDINLIPSWFEIAKKIIDGEPIDSTSENFGFAVAINWIRSNVSQIFESVFSSWELKIGLFKEFLQASYRINSIPASKRALALLSAYYCLESADRDLAK